MGETIPFLLDTGACNNMVCSSVFNQLRSRVQFKPVSRYLFAYGESKRLNLLGQFVADISCDNTCTSDTFFVLDGDADFLMSSETASNLGLLSLHKNVLAGVFRMISMILSASSLLFFTGLAS